MSEDGIKNFYSGLGYDNLNNESKNRDMDEKSLINSGNLFQVRDDIYEENDTSSLNSTIYGRKKVIRSKNEDLYNEDLGNVFNDKLRKKRTIRKSRIVLYRKGCETDGDIDLSIYKPENIVPVVTMRKKKRNDKRRINSEPCSSPKRRFLKIKPKKRVSKHYIVVTKRIRDTETNEFKIVKERILKEKAINIYDDDTAIAKIDELHTDFETVSEELIDIPELETNEEENTANTLSTDNTEDDIIATNVHKDQDDKTKGNKLSPNTTLKRKSPNLREKRSRSRDNILKSKSKKRNIKKAKSTTLIESEIPPRNTRYKYENSRVDVYTEPIGNHSEENDSDTPLFSVKLYPDEYLDYTPIKYKNNIKRFIKKIDGKQENKKITLEYPDELSYLKFMCKESKILNTSSKPLKSLYSSSVISPELKINFTNSPSTFIRSDLITIFATDHIRRARKSTDDTRAWFNENHYSKETIDTIENVNSRIAKTMG